METTAQIAAAINVIDAKKENLRQSFLHLQSQSPSSFNLTLKWEDIDSYFSTLISPLQSQFHRLQTLYPHSDTTTVLARPELKSFCQNSDAIRLRKFIKRSRDRLSLLPELPDAYRCAPNPAAMVLDAIKGFYNNNGCCVMMLEGLMRLKPDVSVELREKAMMVAVELREKAMTVAVGLNQKKIHCKEREDFALGFLLLVLSYGLIDKFNMDEVIDCVVVAVNKLQTFNLCRQMIPDNKINDVIQKLINKDMHCVAVKYIIKFEKTEEFPPVSILDERILKCMHEIMRKNNDCNEAVMKNEVNTLNSILKCIDHFGLKSEYPKESVLALVRELNNRLANKSEDVCKEEQPSKKQKLVQPPVANLQLQTTTMQNDHVFGSKDLQQIKK